MRVGIIALLQESNTFIAGSTTLEHFQQDLLVEGEQVRTRLAKAHHEVGGFFEGLAAERLDAVPLFAARALPYGIVTAEAFAELLARLDGALDRAGSLDGLLVAPHGATVSASFPDADGHWLTQLRRRLGPKFPIIGTLDLHANVSPAMVAACDALIAYRSNPHLDQRQRGIDAAQLLARTLRGEVRPTMAAAFLALAVNIERQLTAEAPCRDLYDFADSMLREPGLLSNSVTLGFPYADVPEMGLATLVVTNNDPVRAQTRADELGQYAWQRRQAFVGHLVSIDDALRQASGLTGTIGLLDMGDNVGGGSPGDGTSLAHALQAYPQLMPAVVCLYDPPEAQRAASAGRGARLTMSLGGKSDDRHGPPFQGDFVVRGIYEGRFEETQPRHGGFMSFDQGLTAVVEADSGLTFLMTSRRMVPFSIKQLTTCELDPTRFRVLTAKGVHAPVAAYAPVCQHLIRVDTPGVTTADLSRLSYHHRRRPMFPFEPPAVWLPRLDS